MYLFQKVLTEIEWMYESNIYVAFLHNFNRNWNKFPTFVANTFGLRKPHFINNGFHSGKNYSQMKLGKGNKVQIQLRYVSNFHFFRDINIREFSSIFKLRNLLDNEFYKSISDIRFNLFHISCYSRQLKLVNIWQAIQ